MNIHKNSNIFLFAIKEFQKIHTDFSLTAAKFQSVVWTSIRRVNKSEGIGTYDDGALQTFFLGRTLGFGNNNVILWVGIGDISQAEQSSYEKRYTSVLESTPIQELIPPYIDSRLQLEKAIEALRSALAEPIDQKRNLLLSLFGTINDEIKKRHTVSRTAHK